MFISYNEKLASEKKNT